MGRVSFTDVAFMLVARRRPSAGEANVTIFGESAGGNNVLALLLSPPAEGLFHRAISQSGGTWSASIADAENWEDDPEPGQPYSARRCWHSS